MKYSQFPIDISDCEEDGGVQAFVIKAIHEKAEELADASGHALQSLSLRVQVTGDCNDPEEVQVALEKLTDLDLSIPDVTTRIDKASIVVTPRLDPTIYEGQTTALAKAVNLMSASKSILTASTARRFSLRIRASTSTTAGSLATKCPQPL